MPRVTKAMLEEDITAYVARNAELRSEITALKQMNEILKRKDFDVDGFCRMHGEAITAIAHTVTDLRTIIQKLH